MDTDFSDAQMVGKGELSFRGASFRGISMLCFKSLGRRNICFSPTLGGETERMGKPTEITGQRFIFHTGQHEGKEILFPWTKFDCDHVSIDLDQSVSLQKVDLSYCTVSRGGLKISGLTTSGELGIKTGLYMDKASLEQAEAVQIEVTKAKTSRLAFSGAFFPEKGRTVLKFGNLERGQVSLDNAEFKGSLKIEQEERAIWNCEFDFSGSKFEGPVHISGLKFSVVPDFTATEFKKHLSLHGLTYSYSRTRICRPFRSDSKTARKLQRIKELAENNKDHQLALQCYADEMRAQRWNNPGLGQKMAYCLDAVYDAVSRYGQSVLRPSFLLVLSWVVFAGWYNQIPTRSLSATYPDLLLFAISVSLPFLPVSGVIRKNEIKELFGDPASIDLWGLYTLMGLQGISSLILIFLIGLGLRNRFRL